VRILVLAPHPFYAERGTPIAVRALCEVLAGAGHSLDLLTFPEGQDVALPGCRLHRVPRLPGVRDIPPSFSVKKVVCDLLMLRAADTLVQRERHDLVHAVEEAAFIAAALGRMRGVPFVYDMDSSLAQQMLERYPLLRPAAAVLEASERWAVRQSVGVLAVCQALAERAAAAAPGHLVARLEDPSWIGDGGRANERLAETIGANGPIVMYVGNLERYQGIDLLLEAFAALDATAPDARLVVVGGTPAGIEAQRRRALALGLNGRAHFVGARPLADLGHYLAQATVLVSPRLCGDNTAMKVYSYMASGRPIVATALRTHTQVLDADSAVLVPPEREALASGILRLLRDPALGARLAAGARQRVAAEYGREAFARKLLDFYRRVESRLADGDH
jgi:glycosyltransferase involved in cell wall biosynthesis